MPLVDNALHKASGVILADKTLIEPASIPEALNLSRALRSILIPILIALDFRERADPATRMT